VVWLPDGEKISKISLLILAHTTNVTDGQTEGQTPHADMYRAYAYALRGKNYMRIQLSLSLHFCLLYLLLNSCDVNDAKQCVFLGRLLVVLKRAGCVGWCL